MPNMKKPGLAAFKSPKCDIMTHDGVAQCQDCHTSLFAKEYNICANKKLKGHTNGKTLYTRNTSSSLETAFHRETDRRTDRAGDENPAPNNRRMDNYGESRAERLRVDTAKDTRTLQKGEAP